MCSRVGFFSDKKFLEDITNSIENFNPNLEFSPSYNIAPSQVIATLLSNGLYQHTHFGFIPNWAKDTKRIQVNARSESITEKVMFKDSIKTKRCIIPANGFYEWQHVGGKKVPYWIYPSDNEYFAFAAIYDEWHDYTKNKIVTSSAIITTEPNDMMSTIHNRMPLILKKEDWSLWLNENITDTKEVQHLFKPYNSKQMQAYPVSSFMSSPINNTPKCIEKVPEQEKLF